MCDVCSERHLSSNELMRFTTLGRVHFFQGPEGEIVDSFKEHVETPPSSSQVSRDGLRGRLEERRHVTPPPPAWPPPGSDASSPATARYLKPKSRGSPETWGDRQDGKEG